MSRVKRGFKLRRRHKKVLKLAKGYRATRSTLIRSAIPIVRRSLAYAYRDRRVKKRDFRTLWIQRINAGCRALGLRYGSFIYAMQGMEIELNRKNLAHMAMHDAAAFGELVEKAKAYLYQRGVAQPG